MLAVRNVWGWLWTAVDADPSSCDWGAARTKRRDVWTKMR